MTGPRLRPGVLGLLLGVGLAACAPGGAPKLIGVDTRQPANTVTRIFVVPSSLATTGHEARVRYTVLVDTADWREGYPGQPRRIEGAIAFDCQARTYRTLAEVTYSFDGRRQPPDPLSQPRGTVEPGSPSALVLDYACAGPLARWWTSYPVNSSY